MPQRITETSGDDYQPLDVHGRRLTDSYDQLVAILRNRLGQNHADFFAQPKSTPGSDATAWFTNVKGEPARLDSLAADEQQRVKQRAERILGDVHGLAADMRKEGPSASIVADMLVAAAQLPPVAPLYSVGGKPVAVRWGHGAPGRVASAAAKPTIQDIAARPAPIPPDAISRGASSSAAPAGASLPGAILQSRRWPIAALAGFVALAAIVWVLMNTTLLWRGAARSGGDLDAQIAEVETRNRALETRIAELKGKAPRLRCVPVTKQN